MSPRGRSLFLRVFILILAVPVILLTLATLRHVSNCGGARPSCLAHRQAGCSITGTYTLQVGNRAIEATCDMKLDQGGWTLVGNYLHKGSPQSKSRAAPLTDRLPLENSLRLGNDEDQTPAWGHAGNNLLAALPFQEMRFRCRTSAHDRLVDFAISSPRCLDYFRTGKGSCLGSPEALASFKSGHRAFLGHTGFLPQAAMNGWADKGDHASAHYPFATDWKYHWSVGAAANRWECDDMAKGGETDTLHQIWIR